MSTNRQTYQSPSQNNQGNYNHYNAVEEFERKSDDESCCSCCIAPCKLIGLLLFLPCCIASCLSHRSVYQKEAKLFQEKHHSTVSTEPTLKLAKPNAATGSEGGKLHFPVAKYKVEPAQDKIKVIRETGESSNESREGIENKEIFELESYDKK